MEKEMGTWQIEHLDEDNIVHVKVRGEMPEDQVVLHVTEALAVASEHEATRFLVDHREMEPLVSMVRIYAMPGVFEKLGLSRIHRLAVLFTPSSKHAREYEFFETVSVNRGFQVRLFEGDSEALAWLREHTGGPGNREPVP